MADERRQRDWQEGGLATWARDDESGMKRFDGTTQHDDTDPERSRALATDTYLALHKPAVTTFTGTPTHPHHHHHPASSFSLFPNPSLFSHPTSVCFLDPTFEGSSTKHPPISTLLRHSYSRGALLSQTLRVFTNSSRCHERATIRKAYLRHREVISALPRRAHYVPLAEVAAGLVDYPCQRRYPCM